MIHKLFKNDIQKLFCRKNFDKQFFSKRLTSRTVIFQLLKKNASDMFKKDLEQNCAI